MSDNNPSVGRSSAVMAAGTLASRLTGAIRTIALGAFGYRAFTDVYTQANTTPNMVYELVAGGVLSATLVPLFAQLMRRNNKRSQDGLNAIISLFTVVVVAASVLLALAAPLILRIPYGDPQDAAKLRVGTQLLRLFAPQVAFYGFVTISTSMLNVRRRFFAPMFAPVINNVVVIIVLVWVHRIIHASTHGANYLEKIANDGSSRLLLGLGTTLGVVAMAVAVIPSLIASDVAVRWHWEPRHKAIRELVRLSVWTFGYVACNIAAVLFVQRAAAKGPEGDYASYAAAYSTFFLLPHGLFAVSIATAIQPELADAFLERRRNRFRSVLVRGIRMQLTVMIPAAVGFIILARPIVATLRFGEMNGSDVTRLARILQAFALGLPFFSIYLLLMNACKAMRDTRITFVVNAVENASNILLASLFLLFGWGVRGLALSFAAAYVIGAAIAFVVVHQRLRGLKERSLALDGGRIATASLCMGAAVFGVRYLAGTLLTVSSRPGALAQVGASVVVGVTVYAIVGRLVGVADIAFIAEGLTRRLRSRPHR